jgi:2-dehydro-3-deoxygluconokinase
MAKIVTMGEMLVRFSTKNNEKFIQATDFNVCYGGSESNVAISLANFGHQSKYITKLPDNPIGHSAVATLKKYGVDTEDIAYGGNRIGTYYLETGSALRPSKVIYDRADSSMSHSEISDFDFDKIFCNADWFHFSGITPAISEKAAALTLKAVEMAKKYGLMVSCDLNFRKKLWTREKAQQVMPQYMEYVDVCMGGREDAIKMLGFHLNKVNEDDTPNMESYEQMFREMTEKYKFKYVASSLRQSHTSSYNELSGCIFDGEKLYQAANYHIEPMVDRVGGGDAFAAGLISALSEGKTPQQAIDFAVAASALKHTISGDANLATREDVENLIAGKGTGRVSR